MRHDQEEDRVRRSLNLLGSLPQARSVDHSVDISVLWERLEHAQPPAPHRPAKSKPDLLRFEKRCAGLTLEFMLRNKIHELKGVGGPLDGQRAGSVVAQVEKHRKHIGPLQASELPEAKHLSGIQRG